MSDHKIPLERRLDQLDARLKVVETSLELGRKPSEVNSLAMWSDEEILDCLKGTETGRPDRFKLNLRKRGGMIIPRHQEPWATVAAEAIRRALNALYPGNVTVMVDETDVAYTLTWTCDNVHVITANEYIGIPDGLYQLPENIQL